MAKLTRYRLEQEIQGGKPIAHFVIDKKGSWVNFEDSKEFLKTSTNTGIMQFDCDTCTNASRCPVHKNGMRVVNCGFVEQHNA